MHSIYILTIMREINVEKNQITTELKKNTSTHDVSSPKTSKTSPKIIINKLNILVNIIYFYTIDILLTISQFFQNLNTCLISYIGLNLNIKFWEYL